MFDLAQKALGASGFVNAVSACCRDNEFPIVVKTPLLRIRVEPLFLAVSLLAV